MAGVSYISQGDIVPLVCRLRLACVRATVLVCLLACLLFRLSPWVGRREGGSGRDEGRV